VYNGGGSIRVNFNDPVPWSDIDAMYFWSFRDNSNYQAGWRFRAISTTGTQLWSGVISGTLNAWPVVYTKAITSPPPPISHPPPINKRVQTPCERGSADSCAALLCVQPSKAAASSFNLATGRWGCRLLVLGAPGARSAARRT
jgi:hypothetical protein